MSDISFMFPVPVSFFKLHTSKLMQLRTEFYKAIFWKIQGREIFGQCKKNFGTRKISYAKVK